MNKMRIGVTGGTGFVGRHLINRLAKSHEIIALARDADKAQPIRNVEWQIGDVNSLTTVDQLIPACDVVIHMAALTTSEHPEQILNTNVGGTVNVVKAAKKNGSRLILVSSLAARHPDMSIYGQSKRRSEMAVQESGLEWTIVRPPAVFGKGDIEMAGLIQRAALGKLVPWPHNGLTSVLHAPDLASLLAQIAESQDHHEKIYEPDDGTDGGWRIRSLVKLIGNIRGRNPRLIPVGNGLFRHVFARFGGANLTPDRLNYLCHENWVSDAMLRPSTAFWVPSNSLKSSLEESLEWYLEQLDPN